MIRLQSNRKNKSDYRKLICERYSHICKEKQGIQKNENLSKKEAQQIKHQKESNHQEEAMENS